MRWIPLALLLLAGTVRAEQPPRLVVIVVVDQMRADYLERLDRLGTGQGIQRLLREGHHFREAHYGYAATVTAAGHATLMTGCNPRLHGQVANTWWNKTTNQPVYSVADPDAEILDPPGRGVGPTNLLIPTLGDAMRDHWGDGVRVFGVSSKDRSAATLAGHGGTAYWFNRSAGRFTSSTAYFPTGSPPDWVGRFHETNGLDRFAGGAWDLVAPPKAYRYLEHDDRGEERRNHGWTATFPHDLPDGGEELWRAVRDTPFIDAQTLDFVEALVVAEGLGQDEVPDMLGVGFSGVDYVGHDFGPHSLEIEDALARLDRTLTRFWDILEARVGLENVLIAFSSDHGVDGVPELRRAVCQDRDHGRDPGSLEDVLRVADGFPVRGADPCRSGRLDTDHLLALGNKALRGRLGVREDLVAAYRHNAFYLDESAVGAHGLDVDAVAHELAEVMGLVQGIRRAVPRAALTERPEDPWLLRLWKGYHPERSGHVFLNAEPFWYLYGRFPGDAARHGSPYPYDTHVPLAFWGPGIEAGVTDRGVSLADLAPTLARALGIPLPAATGSVLEEALR